MGRPPLPVGTYGRIDFAARPRARSAPDHPLLPIFGLTADEMGSAESVLELLLDTLCAGFVLPHTTTTVVHDWTIVEVAHRIERGDLRPGRANLDLLRQILGFSEASDDD